MDNLVHALRCQPGDQEAANEAVEALFAALPACAKLNADSRVLLKPNLLSKSAPDNAVTTHPTVVRAVILALRRRRVRQITLADSPGGPYSPFGMEEVYRVSGLAEVCRENDVELYTACESGPREADGEMVRSFTLLRPVLDSDFIINLPKLKTHVLTGMSGAVKNLFGTVPGLQKAEFHMRFPDRDHFGSMLIDLCETVRPDITLVDGLLGMEGDGPGGGIPRPFGLLLAGENPYTLDMAICRFFGMTAGRVPTLKAALRRGLCTEPFDTALLQGDADALEPLADFRPPRSYDGPMNQLDRIPKVLHPFIPVLTKWVAPRPVIERARCIGCGKCAEICPRQVIEIKDKKATIHRKNCIRCFCCHEMCPVKAIGVKRFRFFQI